MEMDFSGKTVLITGANRGLGLIIANAFSGARAKVHSFSRRSSYPLITNAIPWLIDVGNAREITSITDEIKPDILINNAAITLDSAVHKMTDKQWGEVLTINLTGVFNCVRAVLPHMREKGYGRIVNIVSVLAHMGCAGAANYAASKAGVIGLTKSVALESAHKGITCNAVALGFMGAGMCDRLPEAVKQKVLDKTPMGRFGTPKEAADAVIFLASDMASFITGEVLNVNGGYYL